MNRLALLSITLLAAFGSQANAQDSVRELQYLVGARGSSGESELETRGYTFVGGEKSGDSSYTYWKKGSARNCISVRTADGRYQSIVHVPESDCSRVATPVAATSDADDDSGTKDRFDTVCGVIVDGKTSRYRCTAVDIHRDGRKVRTVLHYPDQKIVLVWKSGKQMVLRFEGMKPQPSTFASAEGETNFSFEGTTYFYISDKGAAEWEVKNFKE